MFATGGAPDVISGGFLLAAPVNAAKILYKIYVKY
jgi:hypothetical protein